MPELKKKQFDKLKKTVRKPKVYTLEETGNLAKVVLFGGLGTGKTRFLLGALLEGERVFGVSSDFGGNGLKSVYQALKQLGRLDLAKNLKHFEPDGETETEKFKQMWMFLKSPESVFEDLAEFDPTVCFWDGGSGFQMGTLYNMILESGSVQTKADGLFVDREDSYNLWDGMRNGLMKSVSQFISMTVPTKEVDSEGNVVRKPVSKVMTILEDSGKQDKLISGKIQTGFLIQGTARTLIGAPFDLCLQCFVDEKKVTEGGKTKVDLEYCYRCVGDSTKYAVKSRGIDLPPIMIADSVKVWRRLRGKD